MAIGKYMWLWNYNTESIKENEAESELTDGGIKTETCFESMINFYRIKIMTVIKCLLKVFNLTSRPSY